MAKVFLHIGCGNRRFEGFINSDLTEMDVTKLWPYENESIDGIISMQLFQQLPWKGLLVAFKESFRVLKRSSVMRFGTMLIDDNNPDYALGWKNVNLFSFNLLKEVLQYVGYAEVKRSDYKKSIIKEFRKIDNRHIGKGTAYIEAIKW